MSAQSKTALKTTIDTQVTTNGNNEITGAELNAILKNQVDSYEDFVGSYTTAQIAALTGMTLRQRVFNTTDNDYEWYDGVRWVKEAHPKYKVYKAIFNDDGVTPTVTIRENNLGTVTWVSDTAGNIQVTATGLLTSGKTRVIFTSAVGTIEPDRAISYVYGKDTNGFIIKTYDITSGTPTPAGGYLDNASIEIQVDY